MSEQHEILLAEMQSFECPEGVLRAMKELSYTASETGITDFAFHDDETIARMWSLFKLAEKYSDQVPEGLRM